MHDRHFLVAFSSSSSKSEGEERTCVSSTLEPRVALVAKRRLQALQVGICVCMMYMYMYMYHLLYVEFVVKVNDGCENVCYCVAHHMTLQERYVAAQTRAESECIWKVTKQSCRI